MSLTCVLLGAGNVATHLGVELQKKGFKIAQVYSRTIESSGKLAQKLKSSFTNSTSEIIKNCDFYIVALKDDALESVLPFIDFNNKLLIHCSGSLPVSVLNNYSCNTGVIYPLQTFSRQRVLNFSEIPIFIEANTEENLSRVESIAKKLSDNVQYAGSDQRQILHIAAVFACNFVNHFYVLSESILNNVGFTFDVLKPLVAETANKIELLPPQKAQTGPAVRFDKNIINKHLKVLEEKGDLAELYKVVSESIFKFHQKLN